MWGRGIYDPGPLYIRAQDQAEETYYQGRIMKARKKPKDVAEDNLTLSIP